MSIPKNPRELKAAFPYMFTKVSPFVYRGWFPIFSECCVVVDGKLETDKTGFAWTQLKEKFGSARFYWGASISDRGHFNEIGEIIRNAENLTREACILCGSPGKNSSHCGNWLVVCDKHLPEHIKGHINWEALSWTKHEI